jgi:hypothetical protein
MIKQNMAKQAKNFQTTNQISFFLCSNLDFVSIFKNEEL